MTMTCVADSVPSLCRIPYLYSDNIFSVEEPDSYSAVWIET